MKKTDQAAANAAGVPEGPATKLLRDIPNPPGGGSWTWDEPSWSWISNDPAVDTEVTTPE
jgi:hypothetical protein